MSENPNPNSPAGQPENALAKAFEELMAGRLTEAEVLQGEQANGASSGQEGGCPEPGDWIRLLSGKPRLQDRAEAAKLDALLGHAAVCRACATRMQMLTAEATPEETAELSKLASASSDWQRELAFRLAQTPSQARSWAAQKRVTRFYLWAGAGMAATLVLASVAAVWWQRENTPERLLAEAYTHSRIFELRMPGAGYSGVSPSMHLRGSATAREPARLQDARTRIERQLASAPEDAHWLQLEARADVMEEKFDPAIQILDGLLAAAPATSSLLVDDAAAYFERGALTGSERDRATALEYLRHADELAPGDPVVLFNEAVAMEDRGQMMNAVETWTRYLRFERDPRWLAEGRQRLQALEQKLNQLKSHPTR